MRRELQTAQAARAWVDEHGGIVHRGDLLDAGWRIETFRAAVHLRLLDRLRRNWFASEHAPKDLAAAASVTARLTCLSAARRRGWWVPENADESLHLQIDPHGSPAAIDAVKHWGRVITPAAPRQLLASVEDTLAHVAECVSATTALAIWESAMRRERLSADALRRIRWGHLAARTVARSAGPDADSGLETFLVDGVRRLGVPVRQQALIAGHRVDALVGERLVLQADGFAHHSSASERSRDIAHDAELTLRGYTVLRFSYAQIMYELPSVMRTITRAIAAGAHLGQVR